MGRVSIEPAGWLYSILVNKHASGPPLEGQIKMGDIWGTPSNHRHFSLKLPSEPFIWWKAPVYFIEGLDND